jgi:arylsulfatase A-like enzyme
VDAAFGRILDDLDAAGLAERTLVVLTSDHGEYAGDYGLFAKHGFAPEAFHVPLAIRDPRAHADSERGRRLLEPVGAIDIIPTLAARTGVTLPPDIDGRPLTLQAAPGMVSSAMDFSHLGEERPDLDHEALPRRAVIVHTRDGYVVGFDRGAPVAVHCDERGSPNRTRTPTASEISLLVEAAEPDRIHLAM